MNVIDKIATIPRANDVSYTAFIQQHVLESVDPKYKRHVMKLLRRKIMIEHNFPFVADVKCFKEQPLPFISYILLHFQLRYKNN